MCVKGLNIFETSGPNMRLAKNMYSFAKMSVTYSSSQLLVVLTSALKPQFKVATHHHFFWSALHFCQAFLPLFFMLAASWSSPPTALNLFHPTSLISVRKGDGEKEMLTSV